MAFTLTITSAPSKADRHRTEILKAHAARHLSEVTTLCGAESDGHSQPGSCPLWDI